MKGIDVSRWQGDINWESVKADGIEFAIIKAGGSDAGFYQDPKFERIIRAPKTQVSQWELIISWDLDVCLPKMVELMLIDSSRC